ncbi:MAG: protein-L-isoaspartate(D-aspartate) O-methyltransferase [Deltaproteobacteria bacterium]|nr:protein-L-isoaspartate(D-aspartate) O-methyltransferase [Deltaproteobacteria bacterium]
MEYLRSLDWKRLREMMVRRQIRDRGVADPRVLEAMARVERHRFVPENVQDSAYDDTPLPIGYGQTISQPLMVALMTEALRLRGGEKVLEVGTGSGYQAAVLAEIGCTVFTVERDPVLAENARTRLRELGYGSVYVSHGDGTLGLPDEAPFQGIIVTAGGPRVPESLKAQLDPRGGTLVIPVGEMGYQELLRIRRDGETYRDENLGGCRFVRLVGHEGWPE